MPPICFHDRERLGVGERQPVGALLDQRGVDIDDRRQAHDVADLVAVQAVGISGAVEEFVMVQHHVEHLRPGNRLAPPARRSRGADACGSRCHFLARQRARLVEDRDRDERLADIVQQRGAGQTALVVLAHAEMLGERHRKAGDEQAVAIAVGVMAADRRQPFPQRAMLDGLEDLVFGLARCR